jgi:ATP-dependent DNA helicase DinG
MKYLGIDPAKAAFLSLDSPFPLEHRLIHVCPLVRWKWQNPEPAIASLCQALERILALHPGDRGLVHVSSYPQARAVVGRSRNPRLITHETARDKESQMAEMFETPGAVMVSPSSHEGLDLYDDRSRFQVIGKLPFASIGDKRIKRRMECDKDWYPLHTTEKLIQACGRSIRSDVDYATTYIVDAGFDSFYQRAHHLFPHYFLDSLRTGEVPL